MMMMMMVAMMMMMMMMMMMVTAMTVRHGCRCPSILQVATWRCLGLVLIATDRGKRHILRQSGWGRGRRRLRFPRTLQRVSGLLGMSSCRCVGRPSRLIVAVVVVAAVGVGCQMLPFF